MKKKVKNHQPKLFLTVFVLGIFILPGNSILAQETENEFQSRTGLTINYKPLKKIKLSFAPELRLDENFSPDKYLFETNLEYSPLKYLSLGATYRFEGNVRDNKDTEYWSRYAFSATGKKEFGRFEPAFRLKYSNYADDEIEDKTFLRYKSSLKYDIPKCKITPSVSMEAFQQLGNEGLYKMRYSAGLEYKLFKNNYIGLKYKYDYYIKEPVNRHIIGLNYKLKIK